MVFNPDPANKPKFAFIVQRYGEEILGGAEYMTLQLAEHLQQIWQIDVITTCAKSYLTWENEYTAGSSVLNGITVHRFPTQHPRKRTQFRIINRLLKLLPRWLHFAWLCNFWIDKQGPRAPELISFLRKNYANYQLMFFVTYLYYTTTRGLDQGFPNAVLISTAHDEPEIQLGHFKPLFQKPQGFIFMTPEERDFIHRQFNNQQIPHTVLAMGITQPPPDQLALSAAEVQTLAKLEKPFVLYIGRIDKHKGCNALIDYFMRYKTIHQNDHKLVLIGPSSLIIAPHEDVIYLGRVSEAFKWALIEKMHFLVMPSKFESLSIVILEAWLCKKPVLINNNTPVLRGQLGRSQGGLGYNDEAEFVRHSHELFTNPDLQKACGEAGYQFVQENYSWQYIIDGYQEFAARI